MEELIKRGFSYRIELKSRRNTIIKDMSIYYYDIEIYHQILHMSVLTDILFMSICNEYIKNFISHENTK
jgi:hypothetical protein